MSDSPRVSVVIPTFNRAELLQKTLASAFEQTCTSFEIIVVDDGSTDGTEQAIAAYIARGVRYIYQQNGGLSAARNTGLRHAHGEWVAFLDSDDLWERDRLDAILAFAAQHPDVGYINTGRQVIRADGSRTNKFYSWRGRDHILRAEELLQGVKPGGGMVLRSLAIDSGCFDEQVPASEDLDFCLRLAQRTRLAELGRPLLLVRVHGRTLSRQHLKTAVGRFRILDKLEAEQPQFCRAHAGLIRRLKAAAHSRMGRALLTEAAYSPKEQREARHHFLEALRLQPLSLRNLRYAAIGTMAPDWYRRRRT